MILFSVSIISPFGQRMHQKEVVLTLKINQHNQSEPCYLTIGPVRTNTFFHETPSQPVPQPAEGQAAQSKPEGGSRRHLYSRTLR